MSKWDESICWNHWNVCSQSAKRSLWRWAKTLQEFFCVTIRVSITCPCFVMCVFAWLCLVFSPCWNLLIWWSSLLSHQMPLSLINWLWLKYVTLRSMKCTWILLLLLSPNIFSSSLTTLKITYSAFLRSGFTNLNNGAKSLALRIVGHTYVVYQVILALATLNKKLSMSKQDFVDATASAKR